MKSHNYDVNNSLYQRFLAHDVKTMINIHKPEHKYTNVLATPITKKRHILLLYEEQAELDRAIVTYVNDGLSRGQLCMYVTFDPLNENYYENPDLEIDDCHNNILEGNLMMMNLEIYHQCVKGGSMESFEKVKKSMLGRIRKDKCIRIIEDCAHSLLEDGYIDGCVDLENWWHQDPFSGSCICPYPKSLITKFPDETYFSTLFNSHDVIIDCKGQELTEYINLKNGYDL